MPHFNYAGQEQWVCQKGAHVCTGASTWVEGVGNVCSDCLPNTIAPPKKMEVSDKPVEFKK